MADLVVATSNDLPLYPLWRRGGASMFGEVTDSKRTLRERVFILEPARYEIRCDLCAGVNITWSEYEHLIWCYDCQEDTAGTGGIFDGPIPLKAMELFGLSLDMVDLKTGQRFTPVINEQTRKLEYVPWKPEAK